MKPKLLIVVFVLVSTFVWSQGARYDSGGPVQTSVSLFGNSLLRTEPSASITVCSYPATGGIASGASGPCTNKAAVCPDYTLVGCTTGAPNNPVTSDTYGNYGFWVSPALYQYTICPVSGVCRGPYNAWVPFGSTATGTPVLSGFTAIGVLGVKIGTTDQAKNGLTTRVPTNIDIEDGSAASPTTTKYQTSPNLYVSDYGATVGDAPCITGMAAPCLSPLAIFEGTNQSATTSADLTGLMVNLWGAKASTQTATWGNQWIGGAFQVFDSVTPNIVQLTGLNPNVGAASVPGGCFKGVAVSGSTCGRVVNGLEIDVTNGTATDGVFDNAVGNQLLGASIQYVATNATPKDGTIGLGIGTGTTGHGFQIGQVLGGATGVGLLIPQSGIASAPSIAAIHVASQGAAGIIIGTGSTTYTHGLGQTLANPAIGILFDALRTEGATNTAQSNTMQFRSATGAATYANWKQYVDNTGSTHWQTDKVTPNVFADAMIYNPNATPANSSLVVTGVLSASNYLLLENNGANYIQLVGAPTGARAWTFRDTSDSVVGLGTTDTFTGTKTFSTQLISSVATGTAPFSVASTTNVANLNASSLGGATFAAPGAIGGGTPSTGAFTTVTVGTETFSKSPRMVFPCFASSVSGIVTLCAFVTEQPITITRLMIQQLTAPVTCSPYAVVSAFDLGGSSILTSITESTNGNIDGGAVSVNVAAGKTVAVRVTTAAAGCGTSAANVTIALQYKMQ